MAIVDYRCDTCAKLFEDCDFTGEYRNVGAFPDDESVPCVKRGHHDCKRVWAPMNIGSGSSGGTPAR